MSAVAPVTADHVRPPSVDDAHWTVGVGVPAGTTEKVADPPTATVVFWGGVVTEGATASVRLADVVVAVPTASVNTARYRFPAVVGPTVTDRTSLWPPIPTEVQEAPSLVDDCHCTVRVAPPTAAALKEAIWPLGSTWLTGCRVTTGAARSTREAAWVSAKPATLVKMARSSSPLCAPVAVKV